jgi:hypothetical protein
MLHRTIAPLPADINPQGGGKISVRIANWLQKSLYFLYVLLSLELGMLLLCLPWMSAWENNYLLYLYPQFRPLVSNPFFKGFVLGLGIVNILIGIHEVAQVKHGWKNRHLSL